MIQKSLSLMTLTVVAMATTTCLVNDRKGGLRTPDAKPFYTTVDAGETLSTALGEGAAVFVEYQRGGTWRVWTSCDTKTTGRTCQYQINVAPRGRLDWVNGVDLETSDYYERYDDGTFSLFADTSTDTDAIEFATKPGALVDIELFLDGSLDSTYFVWYGNNQVQYGPEGKSPIVFQPDAP